MGHTKLAAFTLAALLIADASASGTLDDPTIWVEHVENDLLPFWSEARAGRDAGNFPGQLCNDGSLPDPAVPCNGVTAWQASNPVQTIVGQSRQVFSYAVAFHLTGNPEYLNQAKAGIDYQVSTFFDPATGLYRQKYNELSGALSPSASNPNSQKQAYGLLGPTFYYYLTGDTEVYEHIRTVQTAIDAAFRDPISGSYGARMTTAPGISHIVYTLDQLNSYQVLLAAQAPVGDRAELTEAALGAARFLVDEHFDQTTGLMKPYPTDDDGVAEDYGHSIKAFWFIDQIARAAGDADLSAFATDKAKDLLELALQDNGAWAGSQDENGTQAGSTDWWTHAELDQFGAALAINDPDLRDDIEKALDYWLLNFVDSGSGGIFARVDLDGNAMTQLAKHWEWKAGFHAYEHALMAALSAAAIGDLEIDLFFTGTAPSATNGNLAYGISGTLVSTSRQQILGDGTVIVRSSYKNLGYGLTAAPVPLTGAGGFLAGSLAFFALWRRRGMGGTSTLASTT